MKIALGIFHFNPHWNADTRSAHRHCTEALAPFLRALEAHGEWRVSLEISGSGLEFVERAYPEQLRRLRSLVEKGQIELISSLYTPSLWIAFPRRDLEVGVELNRKCLARLGLPATRIFFAQEAFFGSGVTALQDHFDVAICKDDYLAYYYDLDFSKPCFTLKGMKVVVASNHLLNELAHSFSTRPEIAREYALGESHLRHLTRASQLNRPENFPAAWGAAMDVEWRWYHCGDGNHFGTIHKPDQLEHCYFDPTWSRLCVGQIESYRREGWRLGTVGELVAALDYRHATELPPLLEGAWNARVADGVFCWMGWNATPWENDAYVLTSIARSRARLLAAERGVALADPEVAGRAAPRLEDAWGSLLHAQISDTLGWNAGPGAVQYSLGFSDHALVTASQILGELEPDAATAAEPPPPPPIPPAVAVPSEEWPLPELFGASGGGSYTCLGPASSMYECVFAAVEADCGIRFPFEMDAIVFCPSGAEMSPETVPIETLKPPVVTLPLANGLLQIGQGLFLVKDTVSIHVAARILLRERRVEFRASGVPRGKRFLWRFYVLATDLEHAIAYANAVNGGADPHPVTRSRGVERT
jgi:hypothetical protein